MRTGDRLAWICVALCIAAAAARGAAEPVDPARIEELSAAAARQLAAEFPGATVDVPIRGGAKKTVAAVLALPRLRTLTPDAAAALAEFKGSALLLDGLTELSPRTAEALTRFTGSLLSLAGLTTLSPEVGGNAGPRRRRGRARRDPVNPAAGTSSRCPCRSAPRAEKSPFCPAGSPLDGLAAVAGLFL